MGFKMTIFTYMPPGSFAVMPDNTLHFRPSAPKEAKERMLEEWPKYVEEVLKRHEQGIYDPQDLVY